MKGSIGLDIGGTKIAGALFDVSGARIAEVIEPTPKGYEDIIVTCAGVVAQLEKKAGKSVSIGACAPYFDGGTCVNIPVLSGQSFHKDLETRLKQKVAFGNDAGCAALAEALEGAGKGYRSVFGLIIGTGVGGGFVLDGNVVAGVNGLCGEVGHMPMPFYEESDGEAVLCKCGVRGCVETMIAGGGLSRLYMSVTGHDADAKEIGKLARDKDAGALKTLDRYYTLVAKSMMAVVHTFDPSVIVVSGGLNSLPGLYEEVPKRWDRYSLCTKPATVFAPAALGAMAGLRGAALLGQAGFPAGGDTQ